MRDREEHNSALSIIIRRSIGFVVFIILLLIAVSLSYAVQNSVYSSIITFFNVNIPLFFSIFLFGIINEIFWILEFPLNILAPITSSILSVIVTTFIYRIWLFLNTNYIRSEIAIPIGLIYILVFIIAIIAGYANLAREGFEFERFHKVEWNREKAKLERESRKKKEKIEWGEVEDQFKLLFYNIGDSLNRAFERHRKRHERK